MRRKIQLGILGCGTIGGEVAKFVDRILFKKLIITSLYDKDILKAKELKKQLIHNRKIKIVNSQESLVGSSDLILESASWETVASLLSLVIRHRKEVIILSVGGLLGQERLLRKAEQKRVNIYIPSGAICGIDGVLASSLGEIKKCILKTSKPPQALESSEFLRKKNVKIEKIKEEKLIFKGSVREVFKHFPRNINVAATLSLSSGLKDIEVQITLNPGLRRNTHNIFLESDIGRININVENIPSSHTSTSVLAIYSTKALLKKLTSSLKIGV